MGHLATVIPASEARINFYDIIDEVSKTYKRFVITKRGRVKAVIMNFDEFDSLEETNEILADKKLVKEIEKAEKDIAEDRYVTLEELKKELKWIK